MSKIKQSKKAKKYLKNMNDLASMYSDPNNKVSGKFIFDQIAANKKGYLKEINKTKNR
jgi:hypothetical protein